ncbi:MAG: hypothetical protein HOV80_08690 [Polyangiaceae bacterium]|nr:hypothetical protein [Polyangiaceae bacterium]
MLLRRTLPIASFLVIFAACTDDGDPGDAPAPDPQETFVGAIEGTDVRFAIVRDDDHVALFFCGGPDSFATSTQWIRAEGSGPAYELSQGTWAASFNIEGASATGTVDRGDGMPLTFTAARVDEEGLAGLYETEEADGRVGVVVAMDEAGQAVVQGALVTPTIAAQVVPISPVERVADRLRVQVLLAEPKNLTVRRALAE